jgi:hypothetical protein
VKEISMERTAVLDGSMHRKKYAQKLMCCREIWRDLLS